MADSLQSELHCKALRLAHSPAQSSSCAAAGQLHAAPTGQAVQRPVSEAHCDAPRMAPPVTKPPQRMTAMHAQGRPGCSIMWHACSFQISQSMT